MIIGDKTITIPWWRLKLLSLSLFTAGMVVGSYLTVTKFVDVLFAADTVSTVWEIDNSGDYVLGDSSKIEVAGGSAQLSVQNYQTDANTKLLLHLDESSGVATDSSGNSNTVTMEGPSLTTGNLNNGASFDGVNDRMKVADSSSLSLSQSNTLESWVKFDNAFSAGSQNQRAGVIDKGEYQLYFDNETGKLTYELADSTADTWEQVGGNDLGGSWDINGNPNIESMVELGGSIYVGTGNGTGDAEVWKWDGANWTQVGGDGLNSCWAVNTFESVLSLSTDGTYIYAGLGTTAGDAEVWRFNGTSWTKVGGDALNSSWAINTFEGVYSLVYQGTSLYAGLGNTANDAEVWRCDNCSTTPAWTKVGGDSLNSGWTTNYELVWSMVSDGTYLYVGLGTTAGDAEVWRCNNCSTTPAWTRVGGDAINSSWANSTYEYVLSLTAYGGDVYAGLGNSANDAEVWQCTSCASSPSWSQIGGDSLNSGWTTNYEGVYALTNDGTNLYAGLGNTAGDNEVWQWGGSSWTKIGGDALDSSFNSSAQNTVNALIYTNSTLYAGLTTTSAAYSAQLWKYKPTDSPKWTLLGGNYVNFSWGYRGLNDVEVMNVAGDYLYAGTGYQYSGNAMVFRYDGTSWLLVGGQGVNGSWAADTYEKVSSMVSYKGVLYVGLGSSANDAEVWKCDNCGTNPTWTQVGGDSLNSGWTTNFEEVISMAVDGDYMYAGLGNSGNDAEVWRYNGSSWFKVGGDSLYTGWTTNYEQVLSLAIYDGKLIAGLGNTNGDAELWACTNCSGTPSWTKIAGDGANSSWNASVVNTFNNVDSLSVYDGKLIVGLGIETGEAVVWQWDGSTWTQIGGDDLNGSWAGATYERVRTTVVYNGDLFAGLGNTAGDAEIWKWNGSSWSQMGGDTLNSSWGSTIEEINSFSIYKGRMYTGVGNSANADAGVYVYGNNAVLKSNTASWDTNWHHIAATYDGTTMKIYIDGVLDNSADYSRLMPDTTHSILIGGTYAGREFGKPAGYFAGKLDEMRISNTARTSFNSTPYTAEAQTVYPAAAAFTSGIASLASFVATESAAGGTITYRLSDNGGSSWKYYNSGWTNSSSTAQANTAAEINTNIASFPVNSSGIIWQAILTGDGSQQVALSGVYMEAEEDLDDPSNPDTLTALSAAGGNSITTNTWYSHAEPYFSFSGASDAGSGVAGYYVYFGTSSSAVPETAGVWQTETTYTASSLTSGQTYYLRISTKDNAQNVSAAWDAFTYKYDGSTPANPSALVVSPAGYTETNSYTFTWTAGSDGASGLAGYQYKTGTPSGELADWSTTTVNTSVELAGAAYQEDANIFYLRAIDNAGNTSTPLTINYYFAGEGPSEPQFLTVTPQTNTVNSFAFSWQAPTSYSGEASDLTYCYTVNTLPSSSSCTYTSAGATSLSASSFATQVGLNTFYLAAKNPTELGGAISYGNYTSVTFTANTSAPGIPLNIDVADISVKSTSNWRLTVSWSAPSDEGSGVENYQIYRSTDDATYTQIATTTGTAYVDTGLSQITYYYKVKACDSVSNCGASTAAVSLLPTGKYTESAGLSSGPTVSSITTKKATISWATDRTSDSKIQYGTAPGDYFDEEPSNSTQTADHTISLSNLTPGTTYYYRAKWTDEDGNTGVSTEKSFATSPAPSVKDVTAKNVGLTTATLSLTVTGASKVKIYYGPTTAFGGVTEQITATSESSYDVELTGLEDGTKYYYQVNAYDAEDNVYEGTILFFNTSPRPKISGIKVQQVKGTATSTALLTWTTNTETTTIVSYYPVDNPSGASDKVDLKLTKTHQLLLRDLLPQTQYVLIAKGRDKGGNEAVSEPQRITTATDTRPPTISNVRVEPNVQGVGEEATAQLVVSWDTDELSSSQVLYGEGSSGALSNKTQKDEALTFNHLVVIPNLQVSKVYHLKVVSSDKANNESLSIDQVVITPKATKSALNLVIQNLSQAFGFLGSVGQ